MSGFRPEELLRKRLWDLALPEERDRLTEMFRRRMRGEMVLDNYETTLVCKDRVTGHNPVAVLYGQQFYYKRLQKVPLVVPGE